MQSVTMDMKQFCTTTITIYLQSTEMSIDVQQKAHTRMCQNYL